MDPAPTVYETLSSGSLLHMVPAIRNILGGFLFSGDDVYKPVRVLSGGERTRLAVARMLLRPSNTLILDEPTNHLDLDSKEVLLDALADYGGTLVFVSHDRYFVERLATKIIEIGRGTVEVYPGTYKEFLWHKEHPLGLQEGRKAGLQDGRTAGLQDGRTAGLQDCRTAERQDGRAGGRQEGTRAGSQNGRTAERREGRTAGRPEGGKAPGAPTARQQSHDDKKKADADARKRSREVQARRARIEDMETRVAACEASIRAIEAEMSAPGFYEDRVAAQTVIDRHQALMWQVGDLMHQWEELQSVADADRGATKP
jgi:ATP-binding cassette subfamily F protein 3